MDRRTISDGRGASGEVVAAEDSRDRRIRDSLLLIGALLLMVSYIALLLSVPRAKLGMAGLGVPCLGVAEIEFGVADDAGPRLELGVPCLGDT